MKHKSSKSAFTLIELLTVIAIIGILAAIIIPTVGRVRGSARNAQCKSNMRQLSLATQLYANDNKDLLPPAFNGNGRLGWRASITSYIAVKDSAGSNLFSCPSNTLPMVTDNSQNSSYSANPNLCKDPTLPLVKRSKILRPTMVLLYADAIQTSSGGKAHGNLFNMPGTSGSPALGEQTLPPSPDVDGGNQANMRFRHDGAANVAMADGSVKQFRNGEIKNMNLRIEY
jgi:prepilin-type N-terminal cleavage/methylation domain-containing protein/prepilin-type processing-associated H-X9-DG protein